mgnify:CR=1 FL=1
MTKEPITFDKLPQAVSYLTEQVEKIYQLVETLQTQKPDNQHQLIDIDKASILIQKSKPTIYRLARTGLIPACITARIEASTVIINAFPCIFFNK